MARDGKVKNLGKKKDTETDKCKECGKFRPSSFVTFLTLAIPFVLVTYSLCCKEIVFNRNRNLKKFEHTPVENVSAEEAPYTNQYDAPLLPLIQRGELLMERGNFSEALKYFKVILQNHPESARAFFARAQAETVLGENNDDVMLKVAAMRSYARLLALADVPPLLTKFALQGKVALEKIVDKRSVEETLLRALNLFPEDQEFRLELAEQYLLKESAQKANGHLEKVLKLHPHNTKATCYLGWSRRVQELYAEATHFLEDCFKQNETDVKRFYIYLGECYIISRNLDKAHTVYKRGAEKGFFLSSMQRSVNNAHVQLRARHVWSVEESGYQKHVRKLEDSWEAIRDEAIELIQTEAFELEGEQLTDTGKWTQFMLFKNGKQMVENCARTPRTCAVLETINDATSVSRGNIKFSLMYPGTHVWAHTGPSNCKLRAHLPLKVPKRGAVIRMVNRNMTWEEGKVLIIDDSFEHEVWNESAETRLILIVDFWHPDIFLVERQRLVAEDNRAELRFH